MVCVVPLAVWWMLARGRHSDRDQLTSWHLTMLITTSNDLDEHHGQRGANVRTVVVPKRGRSCKHGQYTKCSHIVAYEESGDCKFDGVRRNGTLSCLSVSLPASGRFLMTMELSKGFLH